MKIIEQKTFTSELDIVSLDIIDWNRLNGSWENPAEAIRTISSWFLNQASYTIAEFDLTKVPQHDGWPGWQHAGNHEYLGRLYWNAFQHAQMGTIRFHDAPDFSGVLSKNGCIQNFWGDIGKASAQCFALTQKGMMPGDIWISVLNERRQVIIENTIDITTRLAKRFGIVEEEE